MNQVLFFLTLLVVAMPSFAGINALVPERVITPMIDIYAPENKETDAGTMMVSKLQINDAGDVLTSHDTTEIQNDLFEGLRELVAPVFEVTNLGNKASAIHIGQNLVLTNHHVLTNGGKLPENCLSIRVMEKKSTGNYFTCKKVHFCSPENDVCLLEMNTMIKTRRFCSYCRRDSEIVSLADGPSLLIKSKLEYDDAALTTAVGNSLGLGLHVSQGKGLRFMYPDVYFYAPTTTGNSGGALYNLDGELIGLVKSGTVLKTSHDPILAFNTATSSVKIIELVREALKADPETLGKFNQSVR